MIAGFIPVPTDPRISLRDHLGSYLARRERSSASFRYEKPRLLRFLGWTLARGIEFPGQVDLAILDEFQGHMRSQGLAVNSIRAHLLFIRHALPMLPKPPLPRVEEGEARILTEEEEVDMIRASRGTPIEIPIVLAFETGMRVSEVAACREDWFDLSHQVLRIPAVQEDGFRPKGRKGRIIGLTPKVVAMTGRLADPLAPSVRLCHYWIERAGAKAGIKATWHDIRRTWATRLAGKGLGVHFLQQLLGHTSLATTQHYLRVTQEEAAEAMRRVNE